jgi:hypothetical protein
MQTKTPWVNDNLPLNNRPPASKLKLQISEIEILNLNLNIPNVLFVYLSITRSQGISSKRCNLHWWPVCCVAIVKFLVILDKGIVMAKIHACEYHDRPSVEGAWLPPKLICDNFAFQVLDFVVRSVLYDINELNFDIRELNFDVRNWIWTPICAFRP